MKIKREEVKDLSEIEKDLGLKIFIKKESKG